MSKVEGGGVRLIPLKASCYYFFIEASRVKVMRCAHYQTTGTENFILIA